LTKMVGGGGYNFFTFYKSPSGFSDGDIVIKRIFGT